MQATHKNFPPISANLKGDYEVSGLVEPERLQACLDWLECTETDLWSAVAAVGSNTRDIRAHIARSLQFRKAEAGIVC